MQRYGRFVLGMVRWALPAVRHLQFTRILTTNAGLAGTKISQKYPKCRCMRRTRASHDQMVDNRTPEFLIIAVNPDQPNRGMADNRAPSTSISNPVVAQIDTELSAASVSYQKGQSLADCNRFGSAGVSGFDRYLLQYPLFPLLLWPLDPTSADTAIINKYRCRAFVFVCKLKPLQPFTMLMPA